TMTFLANYADWGAVSSIFYQIMRGCGGSGKTDRVGPGGGSRPARPRASCASYTSDRRMRRGRQGPDENNLRCDRGSGAATPGGPLNARRWPTPARGAQAAVVGCRPAWPADRPPTG